MKLTSMLLALAGALILTGCDTPALLSLEPVVTGQDAAFDPTLLGTWEADHGNDLCIIRRDGDTGYAITHVSGGSVRQFSARLFRVGEASVLELTPEGTDDFQIAGHAVVRIWTGAALCAGRIWTPNGYESRPPNFCPTEPMTSAWC